MRDPLAMRAVVLSGPGPVENLELKELPLPAERDGWVRIRVEAFGLNRSEYHTRLGFAEGVVFPRVLGIEAAGTVDWAPAGSGLERGQRVVTMMGGMGRVYDGGYAEYTSVPQEQVIPFESELPWEVLGAVPEMLQTAYGSLTVGLDLRPGQTLLIRGGTSSVGMAAAALARQIGATVLATTRRADRLDTLRERGVAHPLVDDGDVAAQVRAIFPEGVDAALELVGTPTLPDTLRATRIHGTVCMTGMLSGRTPADSCTLSIAFCAVSRSMQPEHATISVASTAPRAARCAREPVARWFKPRPEVLATCMASM